MKFDIDPKSIKREKFKYVRKTLKDLIPERVNDCSVLTKDLKFWYKTLGFLPKKFKKWSKIEYKKI